MSNVAIWSSASWRADATAWLDERLAEAGRTRTGDVTQPHLQPWGTALCAPTTTGPVWLKAPASGTAFEVALYPLLHRLVPDRVLPPIAADPSRGWVLLPDGGPTLRGLATPQEFEEALVEVLPRYGRLQRDLMPHVGELLAAGVADMRPEVLPQRFEEALEAASIAGDPAVLAQVAARRSWFADVAARLAQSPVPASLDHADLHHGNIFAEGTRFYDWGDSVVGHPFATMLVTLAGPKYARPRDAYLEAFTDLAPRAQLLEDLRSACIGANVVRALTWHRALVAQGYDRAGDFALAPQAHLAMLLTPQPWRAPS